jgi:hypothetical protein
MMKMKVFLAKIAGFALVCALLVTACDNGTTGGNPEPQPPAPQSVTYVSEDINGNLYTLVITENTKRSARYAAKDGDLFTFTVELFNNGIYSVALTYSGTVESAEGSGTEIAISVTVNGEALTIAVSDTAMTVISGTIILDNKEEITITEPLTPIVDKTALEAALAAANVAKEGVVVSVNGTDVSTDVYWVFQAQMDSFILAIATAQAFYNEGDADQAMVRSARIALVTATTVFNGQKRFGTKVDLNGTWVSDETQMTLKLENGNWETLNGYPPVSWMKGTFFIRDEKIHLKSTHVFGTDIGLEEKWYTQDEVKNNFDKTINASYEESFEKSWLYPLFVVGSEYSYSLNGSELIVFWVKNEATIYLKN